MAGLEPRRLLSAAMLQAPHPAIWLDAMRTDRDQRQKSRYVQILRLPWLSEMTLKIGNYSGLARAFRTATRRDAFTPEILDRYREAWRQPGAITGMLNWYRALFVAEPPKPAPGSLIPPTLVLWGDRDDFAVSRLADESAALRKNARVRHLAAGDPLDHPRRSGRGPRRAAGPFVSSVRPGRRLPPGLWAGVTYAAPQCSAGHRPRRRAGSAPYKARRPSAKEPGRIGPGRQIRPPPPRRARQTSALRRVDLAWIVDIRDRAGAKSP